MVFIIKILLGALVIFFTSSLLPGVYTDNMIAALWVSVVLAILNVVVKPILIILTIPITILTLGLFLLVINAFLVILTGYLVDGFHVNGFFWALIFSLIISLFMAIFESLFVKKNK